MKQPSILVVPGVGDAYWVMVKLESFLIKNGFEKPHIKIWNLSVPRSKEYIEMYDFIGTVEYVDIPKDEIFHRSYMTPGYDLVKDVHGYDFFICPNGSLRHGYSMEQILPDLNTNWFPPMRMSSVLDDLEDSFREIYGDYIVARFSNIGMWKRWEEHLPADKICNLLLSIQEETEFKILLAGFQPGSIADKIMKRDGKDRIKNITEKVPFLEHLALLKAAKGLIGYASGNLILGVSFFRPTLLFWSDYFSRNFAFNCVPSESFNDWYCPKWVEEYNKEKSISVFTSLLANR